MTANNQTCVVTGASGHLGANLLRTLLTRGNNVRAMLHEDLRAVQGLGIETIQGDLTDPASLCRVFEGADTVYHCAGYISLKWGEREKLDAINVKGVANIIDACKLCGVRRLIHVSTIHALTQEPFDKSVDENNPLVDSPDQPPYDLSKAAGERIVREAIQSGLDAIILNPTGIIGPNDYKPSHVGEVLLMIARGRLPALINAGFDWVDARDVAEAAVCAAERAPAGRRYLLSGEWVSFVDIAHMVKSYTRKRLPRLVVSLGLAQLGAPFAPFFTPHGGRPLYTRVSLHALHGNRNISHNRASSELGYKPRPIQETIHDTLDWFTQRGML